MKVTGTKQTQVEVELSDAAVATIVTSGLTLELTMNGVWYSFLKQCKLNKASYLENGMWKYDYEVRGGSHGWDDTESQRKATNAETTFVELYQQMKEAHTMLTLTNK